MSRRYGRGVGGKIDGIFAEIEDKGPGWRIIDVQTRETAATQFAGSRQGHPGYRLPLSPKKAD